MGLSNHHISTEILVNMTRDKANIVFVSNFPYEVELEVDILSLIVR